jgi:hypothetical protein
MGGHAGYDVQRAKKIIVMNGPTILEDEHCQRVQDAIPAVPLMKEWCGDEVVSYSGRMIRSATALQGHPLKGTT